MIRPSRSLAVALAVAACDELQFFDVDGRHLRTVGGEGEGPGEFRWLKRVFPALRDSPTP